MNDMPLKRSDPWPRGLNSLLQTSFGRGLILVFVGSVLLVMALAPRTLYLRHYVSDDALEKASLLVLHELHKQTARDVRLNTPFLNEKEQKLLAKKNFDLLLKKDGDKVRETIQRVARQIDEENPRAQRWPFLLGSDSFIYLDLTRNVLERGHLGGEIRGSKYFNRLMLAPHGHWEPLTLHPFVGAAVHRLLSRGDPGIPLQASLGFVPLFLITLAVGIFLILCHTFRLSLSSTLVSGALLFSAPFLLRRSAYGWYDNDPYTILFPGLLLIGLTRILTRRLSLRAITGHGVVMGLTLAAYALFWQGWVFWGGFLLLTALAGVAVSFIPCSGFSRRPALTYLLSFTAASFGGMALIFGPAEFWVLFQEGWSALKDFLNPPLKVWPDLYLAVGELHGLSLTEYVSLIGGWLPIVLISLGIGGLLFSRSASRRLPWPAWGVLLLLYIITLALSLGAQRFVLLNLLPCALLAAFGWENGCQVIRGITRKAFQHPDAARLFERWMVIALTICLLCFPWSMAHQRMPELINRIYNQTWDEALSRVNQETPVTSIINTWWPPGHFIKAAARRRVTFDGATLNKPQGYWMAQVFLSTDEKQAVGLLRFLNNGGQEMVDRLQAKGTAVSKIVRLVKTTAALNHEETRAVLQRVPWLSDEDRDHWLKKIHTVPDPAYLMIYKDLVEKSLQISFVGLWDFAKMETIQNDPDLCWQLSRMSTAEKVSFLWSLMGGQPKQSRWLAAVAVSEDFLVFEENIIVNRKDKTCVVNSSQYGHGIPQFLMMEEDGRVIEKTVPGGRLKYTIVVSNRRGTWSCLLLENSLARSLIMKLFLFEGKDSRYFEPFEAVKNLTGRTEIQLYRVNWDQFLSDIRESSVR